VQISVCLFWLPHILIFKWFSIFYTSTSGFSFLSSIDLHQSPFIISTLAKYFQNIFYLMCLFTYFFICLECHLCSLNSYISFMASLPVFFLYSSFSLHLLTSKPTLSQLLIATLHQPKHIFRLFIMYGDTEWIRWSSYLQVLSVVMELCIGDYGSTGEEVSPY
jgi:hypothetical protein